MSSTSFIKLVIVTVITNPFILVYIAVIAFATVKLREKSEQAAQYLIIGCVISLVLSLTHGLLFNYVMESGLLDNYENFAGISGMRLFSILYSLLYAVGFYFIVAASFVDREQKAEHHSVFK